ncbi:MAG: methionyl-tRNA formyltransferase [Actinomycetota bacterium]|nr:methionyl-tRNA formyltransferase [Actinomycetota bacterium]
MAVRIAFLGTPDAAVPSLRTLALAGDVEVAAVVTNPDRPRGRSRRPVPPPVKVAAAELDLPVWQPARPAEIASELCALTLDAAAVVAYGALLPPSVLAAVRRGFVNLHFSLLPRWRGAAPVQHAVRAGDRVSGVTTFVLDEGMDTGPVLDQLKVGIGPEETAGELLARLAELGAPVLLHSLRRLAAGEQPVSQPAEGGTLAPKISPEDVAIDWDASALEIVRLVRSANPVPGAHTSFRGRRLKVWRARVAHPEGPPGRVAGVDSDGPVVGTGEGAVVLTELQPEGRPRMPGVAFIRGYRPEPGERLGGRPEERSWSQERSRLAQDRDKSAREGPQARAGGQMREGPQARAGGQMREGPQARAGGQIQARDGGGRAGSGG